MSRTEQLRTWIKENVPLLEQVYQNKYVGMVYDRFASLSVKRQKQVILGVATGFLFLIGVYLLSSYWSIWTRSSKISQYQNMTQLLREYQKQQKEQSVEMQTLDKNSRLASPGRFKEYVVSQGRSAGISPRMIQVDERGDTPDGDSSEMRVKQATVHLDKVNLKQLRTFLQLLDTGELSLSIANLKISNDDKVRGYMNSDLTLSAYLFRASEDTP